MSSGLDIGSVVAGKFRIERILAEGGMGLVAAATHLQLEQTVALKFFRGDLGTTGEPRMRFMREAKAAAQLKSEYVARVLDVGVTEGGAPYIVMEYLEGQGLERVIADERTLDSSSTSEYAIQACEALAEAHARGIIHRDIKPSNLFLAERAPGWRAIKVLDFGVSKVSLAQASNITTNLNVVMGTPCFMSPEQIQSAAAVDHRTDIWSLGATLYQMLAGRPLFDPALPILALAEEILGREIASVHELRPEVPQGLSDVVARCLVRDREARIGSAGELAEALLPFAPARAHTVAERAATMASALAAAGAPPRTITPLPPEELGPPTPPLGATAESIAIATAELVAAPPPPAASAPPLLPAAPTPTPTPPPAAAAPASPDGAWTPIEIASPTATPRPIVWPEPDTGPPSVVTTAVLPADRLAARVDGWFSPRGMAVLAAGSIFLCVFAFLILPRLVHHPRVAAAPPRSSSVVSAHEVASVGGSRDLVVYVSPAGAQIAIDGSLVAGNPFRGSFPHGGTHIIKAFAAGYDARTERAHMNSDVVVNLSLDRSKNLSSRRSSRRGAGALARVLPAGGSRLFGGGASSREPGPPAPPLVDPKGGRPPLHPIVTVSPYDAQ